MKKMRNSKRGFTLTEIIVVIAIIVIVASAAFVGIAVVIDNAKDTEKKSWRDENSRELFEVEAWDEVDDWTYNVARFFDASTYTPVHTSTPTPTPTTAPTATPTTVPQNGSSSSSSSTNTPTPSPTATNTPTATPTPTTASTGGGPQTNLKDLPDSTVKTDNWGRNVVIANTPLPSGWSSQGYKKVVIVIECDGNIEGLNGVDNCKETHSGKTVTLTVTDPNQTNIGARIYTSSGSAKVVSINGY